MSSHAKPLQRRSPRTSVKTHPLVYVLIIGVGLVLAAFWLGDNSGHTKTHPAKVSAPAKTAKVATKPVYLEFDPPFILTDQQWDYVRMAREVIQNPGSWGVYKPPLNFNRNLLELYMSVLRTENNLSHYDNYGHIAVSYNGCCIGGAQVYAQTSVCTEKELEDIRYNVWCGAAIFKSYYDKWAPKAGDRANEITVAVYKNAVVMNDDGASMKTDGNGLPIIPPDDPDDPIDFASQVASVFTYDGRPMFKFVN